GPPVARPADGRRAADRVVAAGPRPRQAHAPLPDPRVGLRRLRPPPSGGAGDGRLPRRPATPAGGDLPPLRRRRPRDRLPADPGGPGGDPRRAGRGGPPHRRAPRPPHTRPL